MAYKDPEKQRAAWRRYYQKNPEAFYERRKAKRAASRQWISEIKEKLCCGRCGENDPLCLDFHHRDPGHKIIEVGQAIHLCWSRKRVEAEIAKCDVLCANCHRKEHRKDK